MPGPEHCGVGKCKATKTVLTQRDDLGGWERGVCEKHREVAKATKGWTVIWEQEAKWDKGKGQ